MLVVYICAALNTRSSAGTTVRWRNDIDLLRSTRAVQDAYDGDVYNASNDVGLKARCHRGDISEISCQLIALLILYNNSFQSRRCEWTFVRRIT